MNHLIVLSMLFLISSCVSLEIPNSKVTPAKNVTFSAPQPPFESTSTKTSDQLWISNKSGNSISYLSECQTNQDATIEQLEAEALNTLQDLKILETKKIDYNNREALKSTAQGKVDGVPVMMRILTLKKNNCNYTLVYGAVKKNFNSEINHYEQFLAGFHAP